MAHKIGWWRPELRSKSQNLALCTYRKQQDGKSIISECKWYCKRYYSHVSKRNPPRMDPAATKLYSIMTWDVKLVTSWEL